jgi:MoxR-like ATPase
MTEEIMEETSNKLSAEEINKVLHLARLIADNFKRNIVGQGELVESLLICLLAEGHILVEGVPGLAKTRAIRVLAESISAGYKRLQFTPDMLPADIVGTQIFDQAEGGFKTELGPVFTNIVLGDEINRAPAKVQSALLEAMQERQVSIGGETHNLPRPFIVMATQNPIDHEGTYTLPEAQLDRFMFKQILMGPSLAEEVQILTLTEHDNEIVVGNKISNKDILEAQQLVQKVFVDDKVKEYIAKIIVSLRHPREANLSDLERSIMHGPSPRGGISLLASSKIRAILQGRGYVTPDDVKAVAHRCLRHRIVLTYEAEAEAVTSDFIIDKVLGNIVAP